MDFIVLGGVLGAILMVVGIVMRDLVPRRLRVTGDDSPWIEVRDRRRTVRTLRAGGGLTTVAGVLVLLVTVALVLLDASDGLAWTTVLAVAALTILATVVWVLWFRYQESSGAIQRRQLRAVAARLNSAPPRADARRGSAPSRGRRPERGQDRLGPDRTDDGEVEQPARSTRRERGRLLTPMAERGARPAARRESARSAGIPDERPVDRPVSRRPATADPGPGNGGGRPRMGVAAQRDRSSDARPSRRSAAGDAGRGNRL